LRKHFLVCHDYLPFPKAKMSDQLVGLERITFDTFSVAMLKQLPLSDAALRGLAIERSKPRSSHVMW
jgi:hypothetical protein